MREIIFLLILLGVILIASRFNVSVAETKKRLNKKYSLTETLTKKKENVLKKQCISFIKKYKCEANTFKKRYKKTIVISDKHFNNNGIMNIQFKEYLRMSCSLIKLEFDKSK